MPEQHLYLQPVTYRVAHNRVVRERGKASTLSCIGCGKDADHWAYNNTSDWEQSGNGMRWSPNPADYDPLCAACHVERDRSWHYQQNKFKYT